ncbi:MAG: hypothetical protein UY67_C0019G0005 [Candidatus Kaiserbacteria bacterium GW2011_GWA2_52_12]|uniref:Uncharacterized protein n=1 Tax=Candidatus Kaiserbacteria bacterium GW2011_GWA2_52_12 TaxID=1618671 RepID=A0A0G1WYN6_9BACT|nr:MAG: hypothetical protein UY67_C0019G0005 [Candidatus Kaiserbacteria bacterium GW2011_GWA2_52_12]
MDKITLLSVIDDRNRMVHDYSEEYAIIYLSICVDGSESKQS